MFKKLSDKFSKGIIYLAAFLVTALMAVMMVIGNSPIYPKLLGRGQTLPALTALEMGSIEYGSLHLSVLYVANAVLLVILFIVLGISYLLKRRLATHEN